MRVMEEDAITTYVASTDGGDEAISTATSVGDLNA